MVQTTNFSLKTDPKLACTCGHPKCDKRSVRQWVLDKVQFIREDLDEPMIITSGGRCPYHPDEVRKSKPGDHQQRYAVDIACDDPLKETKLKVLAGRHGATRVAGSAKDGFIHMAWTPTKRRDVPTWSYK